jgi:4-hydroxybenzoate polyprenyltransferase
MPSALLDLRAWRLALAGPSIFWYFPVFYVLLATGLAPDPLGLFGVLIALVTSASWGFLLNDLADRESDARSGREDSLHGHGIGRRGMYAMILLTTGVSWALVFAAGGGLVFKGVLALNYAIAYLYSAPPARLKVRRFWGFLANSLIERPLPILVLLTYVGFYAPETVLLPILMELSWSVFKHQAADVKGDVAAGITTFAVSLGEQTSNRIVDSFLNPASAASLLALTAMAALAIPGLSLAMGVVFVAILAGEAGAYLAERKGRLTVRFTRTDPPYIIVMNLAYRYLLLPVMAAEVMLLRPEYYALVVFLAACLLFQARLYAGLIRKARASPLRGPA